MEPARLFDVKCTLRYESIPHSDRARVLRVKTRESPSNAISMALGLKTVQSSKSGMRVGEGTNVMVSETVAVGSRVGIEVGVRLE